MYFLEGALAAMLGFSLYLTFTHPRYWKGKIPKIHIGKFQITPNLRISLNNGTIRLHHWILLTATLGLLNHIAQGISNLIFVKLFTVGGIIQGLTFRDRFKFFWKKPLGKLSNYPTISVVIPAYNEEERIAKVLKSLKKQNYRGEFEILVVDNDSSDNTATIAERLGAKVVHEARKGAAYARAVGFKATHSQIIASTDADSILPSNWLSAIAYEFQKRPKAVMVAGMYDFYDGSTILRVLTWVFNYQLFRIFGWYSAANMAVRREAFEKVGGFNVNMPLSEDSDLGIRLRDAGLVVRLANFKVKTSARRFNNLGLFGGLWDYSVNYIKFKLNFKTQKISFRSGSEVAELSLLPRITIYTAVVTLTLAVVFGGAFEIKPVRAQVVKRGHQLTHQISKIDIDMPTLPHVHNHHK